jgi:hypothetical protein
MNILYNILQMGQTPIDMSDNDTITRLLNKFKVSFHFLYWVQNLIHHIEQVLVIVELVICR